MKKQYISPKTELLLTEQIMQENLGGLNGTVGDEGGQLSNSSFMDEEEEEGYITHHNIWDD